MTWVSDEKWQSVQNPGDGATGTEDNFTIKRRYASGIPPKSIKNK